MNWPSCITWHDLRAICALERGGCWWCKRAAIPSIICSWRLIDAVQATGLCEASRVPYNLTLGMAALSLPRFLSPRTCQQKIQTIRALKLINRAEWNDIIHWSWMSLKKNKQKRWSVWSLTIYCFCLISTGAWSKSAILFGSAHSDMADINQLVTGNINNFWC